MHLICTDYWHISARWRLLSKHFLERCPLTLAFDEHRQPLKSYAFLISYAKVCSGVETS
jgi:hypothetical protein